MSVPRLRARLHSQAARCAQVHRATLHDGRKVALKIQYPGVARSIESDVDNLLRLISYANILPKGLYVEAAAKARARLPCTPHPLAAANDTSPCLCLTSPF